MGKKKAKPDIETKDQNLVMLNTRVPKQLVKDVKIFCIEKEITVQQFVTEALTKSLKANK